MRLCTGLALLVILAGLQTRAELPGAAPEIDARKFSSIQSALDALPASGGLVRLPPGTFDISEPLVLLWAIDTNQPHGNDFICLCFDLQRIPVKNPDSRSCERTWWRRACGLLRRRYCRRGA